MRIRNRKTVLAVVCAVAAGCSGSSDRPEMAEVEGVVTYRGEPVEGARVMFFLAEAPRPAVGITDDEGRYYLTSFEECDGAVLGEHRVTIFKKAPPDPAAAAQAAGGPAAATGGLKAREMAKMIELLRKSSLPQKYADPKTSGLDRVVKPDVSNEFDFALED